ncbi:MAG: CRTAC1 family protein [Planctomycetota bacterium]
MIALVILALVAADPVLVDIARAAGITFTPYLGATGEVRLPETMAGGGGFVDYDGDGALDVLLVNGCSWPPSPSDPTMKLYRNLGGLRFRDVTASARLTDVTRGMGFAAADYDNDGDQDLLITGVGTNLFYRNDGHGAFVESAAGAGVGQGHWSTAAAFFDYDRDGFLDLVIGDYVLWRASYETRGRCEHDGVRDYCPVSLFPADHPLLHHNDGKGGLQDVTAAAGLDAAVSKTLGIAIVDVDDDGWLDVFLANDSVPNQLYRNQADGTFRDAAPALWLARSATGGCHAGMGCDVTYEADGAPAIAVGNFTREPVTMQVRTHGGTFADRSAALQLQAPTLAPLTFGLVFLDYDLDGWQDLFLANGHVGRSEEAVGIPYRQQPQLFRRRPECFEPVAAQPGSVLSDRLVGRGCACGDVDGDGDLDVLVIDNRGPVRLGENRAPRLGAFLRVACRGTASNHDGIGALVSVEAAGRVQRDRVASASSYLSQSERVLTFGLGDVKLAEVVMIAWPSGRLDTYRDVRANTTLHAVEGGSDGRSAR